jgi:NADPH2:quinone reductase
MRIVQAETLDSLDHYRILEVEIPRPGPGEVLIRVAACGVGYVDSLVALGRYQVKPKLPHIPGQEIAGWIEAVGEGVNAHQVGDRVMATAPGGFAEYALAEARSVYKIPDKMTFEQAAGFRINYLTALHALKDRGSLRQRERVLVIGAAGGLGAAAVQVGRILGGEVIAVASTEEKRAFARGLGADRVLDSERDGWRDRLRTITEGKGPNVIFDPVCGPLFELAFRSLAWGGRHLVAGFVGGPIPALPVNLTLMKGAALVGVDVRQFLLYEQDHARTLLLQLLDWVDQDQLTPPVGRTFPLTSFLDALNYAISGKGLGKTVLTLGSNTF